MARLRAPRRPRRPHRAGRPAGPVHDGLFVVPSCGAGIATAVGARLHRPQRASAWWLLAAGLGAWALGDVAHWLCWWVLDLRGFAGPSDLLHVAAHPLLAAALLRLAKQARPGRDVEGGIDAAILVAPTLAGFGADHLGAAVSVAHPLGDVVVLGALVRVFAAAGHRSTAFRLRAAAAVVMLVADSVHQYVTSSGSYDGSGFDWLFAARADTALHVAQHAGRACTRTADRGAGSVHSPA
ncbi:hypothetical protein ACFEMC_06075 [Kineococcus sp. DHX-1]|uniref:hypothetical protein n=1 Tax=Kineococcus sp. DHX-1 TaxID=3349638 RepID=UPI0036D23780